MDDRDIALPEQGSVSWSLYVGSALCEILRLWQIFCNSSNAQFLKEILYCPLHYVLFIIRTKDLLKKHNIFRHLLVICTLDKNIPLQNLSIMFFGGGLLQVAYICMHTLHTVQ